MNKDREMKRELLRSALESMNMFEINPVYKEADDETKLDILEIMQEAIVKEKKKLSSKDKSR
jgi:hypothetical protein